MKRILITGITGFVGSHLSEYLQKKGYDVFALSRDRSRENASHIIKSDKVFTIDDGYGSYDYAIRESRPDAVIHLASLYLTNHSPEDITRLVQSNITMGLLLAEAMSRNGCRRLISTGTSWQHYENSSYSPVNLYAATKHAFQDTLLFIARHGIWMLSTLNFLILMVRATCVKKLYLF